MATSAVVYSAVYGGFDAPRRQPIPVRLFTDETHPLPELPDARLRAKWWKVRPDLACPDVEVTIWIDGSMEIIRPDLVDLCLDMLGNADAVFGRHPWRDDIYEEAAVSMHLAKYQGQPLLEQVNSYRRAGHPEHWGLMHAGFLVRRNNARMQAVDEAWWREILKWSIQDQLSLPPLLRTMPLDYRWCEVPLVDFTTAEHAWVHWGPHAEPDIWIGGPDRGVVAPRQVEPWK